MAIDPTATDLARYVAEDAGGPVVMLNLLRFVDGGRARYQEYARAVAPFLARVGGELLYAGTGSTSLVAEAGQEWDAVLLVRYPDRTAFRQMVTNPEYQKITRLRTAALKEAVLQATTPWQP
jgi:uncharacterized protein (DUF1330 family)